MKKRILSVILIIGITASLVACGSDGTGKKKEKSEMETVSAEAAVNDVKKAEETEEVSELALADNAETEISHNAEDYEEQKDIFVVKHIDTGDGTEIDFTNQEVVNGPFTLGDSIDIYSFYFTYAGYTKPNIKIDDVWKVDEWIVVPFAQSSFLVKEEDFNRVAALKEKTNSTTEDNIDTEGKAASIEQNTASQKDSGSSEVAPAPDAATQENALASEPVTTYSEAEVISIVEGALRDAGCRKPEEVYSADLIAEFGSNAGMGWGIDNIPMNAPYTAASQIVEGFQFGGYNLYYIETQGSSNGYVTIKLYRGTHK